MRNFIRVLFLTIGLALFSGSANAYGISDVFSDQSCSNLKSELIKSAEAKSLNGVGFSYSDAFSCNVAILHKNLIVKMFYMMFGDFSLKSMDIVVGITGMFTDESYQFYDKAKTEVSQMQTFTKLISIMQGIVHVGCMFVLLFVSIFYAYYLMNSAHDGSVLGKSTNVFWTTTRLLSTIILCIPISSFSDFAPIQVIIMIFATLGIILANIIWFIMPIFEFLYNDDVMEIQEKNAIANKITISNMVDSNIQMHICDIQARKGIYLYGLDIINMTKENIEGSEFGQCISNNESNSVTYDISGGKGIAPASLNATRYCAANTNKNINVSCGSIAIKSGLTESAYSQYVDSQQDQIRKIAYDIVGRYCLDNKQEPNFQNEVNYAKECAKVLDAGSLSYVSRYGQQVIATYDSAPNAESIISSINSLKDSVYATSSNAAASIVKYDINEEKISEKLAISLIKGWLSSSSFILDLGSEYTERSRMYNETFNTVTISSTPVIGVTATTAFGGIQNENRMTNELLSSITAIKKYADNIASVDNYVQATRENESNISNMLFPAIAMVKEFNGVRDPIAGRLDSNGCMEDFNQCARTSLNPLVAIMKVGADLTASSATIAIISTAAEYIIGMANQQVQSTVLSFILNVLNLFTMFFGLHAIFGLLISYIPAIIIFSFFIGNALGWFLQVCKKIVIAQLWMITHMVPNRNEGFAGKGAGGYKLLIDILLRPSFIVFGVFVTFIMLSVMISILNVLFGIVLNTFVFFSTPGGVIEFITNYILHIVYLCLMIMVFLRAGKAMYKIPNALMEWFEMRGEQSSGMWTEITGRMQSFVMQDMKKIIYLAQI
jgi:conjugal transfer/type IV secretion protein DotA/TraY